MEEKTWTIVQFLDDRTVEAVPSTWIQGDYCHWPSFAPQKMQVAIKKAEPLNTCWPTHTVKIFRNATFDDYFKARAKARIAEETSDLNTDYEGEPLKRRRIQKVLSSSDDSINNESILEKPPKITNHKKSIRENEKEIGTENVSSIANDSRDVGLEFQQDTVVEPVRQAICKNCIDKGEDKDKQMKILIQQGHILRGLITDTLTEVKEVKKMVLKGTVENIRNNNSLFQNNVVQFPIDNDEDFEKLESLLQNEEFFFAATQELSKIGGSNTYDHIKRISKLIISNDHALKYSWQGMKGNRKFKETNLAKLLLRSTEAAGLTDSQKTTESAVQTWLRRASDRRMTEAKRIQKNN